MGNMVLIYYKRYLISVEVKLGFRLKMYIIWPGRLSFWALRLLLWLRTLFDFRKFRFGNASLPPSVMSCALILASIVGLSFSISCQLQFVSPATV